MEERAPAPSRSVGEAARAAGLTVRTLHHYESLGLFRPAGRTASGHRRYTDADMLRLYRIQALKRLGLTLAEVGIAMESSTENLDTLRDLLHRQAADLERRALGLAQLQSQIAGLLDRMDRAEIPDPEQFMKTLEMGAAVESYFSPEQRGQLAETSRALGESVVDDFRVEAMDIAARLRSRLDAGVPPDNPEVRALAARWERIGNAFHGGDSRIVAAANSVWQDHKEQISEGLGWGGAEGADAIVRYIRAARAGSAGGGNPKMPEPSPLTTGEESLPGQVAGGGAAPMAGGVGLTAVGAAAARAVESSRPDAVISDPFAAALVAAAAAPVPFPVAWPASLDGLTQQEVLLLLGSNYVGIRSRFFDDFLQAAVAAGIRQAVILAAGLDTRAFRLDLPSDMHVFEADQPAVLDFKDSELAGLAAGPRGSRSTVGVDFRQDWEPALLAAGFDPARPTAWLAEGLMVYLSAAEQTGLLASLDRLSAAGSVAAVEHTTGLAALADDGGAHLKDVSERSGLPMDRIVQTGRTADAPALLRQAGWSVSTEPADLLAARYGRPLVEPELLALIRASATGPEAGAPKPAAPSPAASPTFLLRAQKQ